MKLSACMVLQVRCNMTDTIDIQALDRVLKEISRALIHLSIVDPDYEINNPHWMEDFKHLTDYARK